MDIQILNDAYQYQRYMAAGYKRSIELAVANGKLTIEEANELIATAFNMNEQSQSTETPAEA